MHEHHAPVPGAGEVSDRATRSSGGRTLRALAADPVYRFAYLVIVLGAAALGLTLALGGFDSFPDHAWQIAVFTALTAAAEAVSLKSPKQHDDTRISPSNLLAFTALLIFGAAGGVISFGVGVLVWGIATRSQPIKLAFNTALFVLSAAGAAAVLGVLSDVPHAGMPIHASDLPAIGAAGVTFFAINDLSSVIVTALAMGVPVAVHLRRNLSTILTRPSTTARARPTCAGTSPRTTP